MPRGLDYSIFANHIRFGIKTLILFKENFKSAIFFLLPLAPHFEK